MNAGLLAAALWTLDHLMNMRAPSEPRLSPDGRVCAYSLGGTLYTQPVSSGARRRIAPGSRPRWSADAKSLAFLDGGKIHRHPAAPLIAAPAGAIASFEWLPAGQGFLAIVNDPRPPPDPIVYGQDDRNARLWLLPAGAGAKPREISPANRHVISFAVSPNGARLVYAAQPSSGSRYAFQSDLFEVDLAAGVEKPLVTQPGRDAEPSFSPDGSLVAFHSMAGSTNYFAARHVAVIPASGGEIRYVTAKSNLDVFRGGNAFAWSPDSRQLFFTAGQGTLDVLASFEIATGRESIVAERVSGTASFSAKGDVIAYLESSPAHPPELSVLDRGSSKRRLTSTDQTIASLPRPKSEVLLWQAQDGLAIEGVLWLPPDYTPGRRIPVLTELHGGPTGAALHSFPMPRTYPTQLFLDQGIAVFAPNFRGSSNYGAAFRLSNSESQGIGDFDDVMTGLDLLVARGIADPDRLGVMGWSYGGYLTGAIIARTRRFKAASIGAPATDWTTYYGQADGPREIFQSYFGGLPWDVPRNYERHSYRARLGEIRTPTLLQVGSVDINHNGEIYQALSDRKIPVEYVVYPREGHAIREPAHVRDLMDRNYRWFLKWLLGAQP